MIMVNKRRQPKIGMQTCNSGINPRTYTQTYTLIMVQEGVGGGGVLRFCGVTIISQVFYLLSMACAVFYMIRLILNT